MLVHRKRGGNSMTITKAAQTIKKMTNYSAYYDKLDCSCYLTDAGRNCKTHWQMLAATATEIVHNTAAVSNFILSTGYCWVCEYGLI
jgi:hypothetical protein